MIFRTELDPAMFDAIVATIERGVPRVGKGGEWWRGWRVVVRAERAEPEPVDLSELDGDEPSKPPAEEEAAVAAPASSSESSSSEENNNAELAWAAALLAGIVRLNRFDLTLDFADKKTLGGARRSYVEAMEAAKMTAEAEGLRKSYKL